jgi:hypothetical protein
MKTIPVIILILTISYLHGMAQIRFEEGYLINNDDQKTECLILNLDWQKNPTYFVYKLDKDGELDTGKLVNVKEFGVYGYSRFIRTEVEIDRSLEDLSYTRHDLNNTSFNIMLAKEIYL